jgi:DNA polymerase alpha subunit B
MLRLYNLDPSALFFKYEAFVMSRPSGLRAKLSVLTLDTARELKKEIQREHQAKAVAVAAGSHTHSETPKSSGVGMRKGKGNMADLGGLYVIRINTGIVLMYSLDGLSTPVRKSGGVPARLASNGGTAPSPAVGSPFGPQSSHDSPSKDLTPLATGSSYRPGPSKLATPGNGDYLSTPVGKTNGDRSGASSPVSGPESPSS